MQTLIVALLFSLASSTSILDHGAKSDKASLSHAKKNSQAIIDAFAAASTTDKVVEVPDGGTFTVLSSLLANYDDVTFVINGNIEVWNRVSDWPEENHLFAFKFENMTKFTITG